MAIIKKERVASGLNQRLISTGIDKIMVNGAAIQYRNLPAANSGPNFPDPFSKISPTPIRKSGAYTNQFSWLDFITK